MKQVDFRKLWDPQVNRIGKMTLFPAVILCFLPVIYLYFVYGLFPTMDVALESWFKVAVFFGPFYIIEPLSYFPVLGLAGTYMAFLSGNIGNMRVPCSAVAQEVVGTTPETPEAEIVSTLGIAGSIITNIIAVTLAAFVGTQLLNLLPPVVIAAVKAYSVPAIIGAVFGQFALQSPRTALIALAIPLTLLSVGKVAGIAFLQKDWFLMVVGICGTILVNRILYQKEKNK